MMTLAQQHIDPWYRRARELFSGVLPPEPIWLPDMVDGPNAHANIERGLPTFAWRIGYPSPAYSATERWRQTVRTACHEIGHGFAYMLPRSEAEFATWRGFDWDTWRAMGREPWEFYADAFGAALFGQWIVPEGKAAADGHRYELETVTPEEARVFFQQLAPPLTKEATIDYPNAIWTPSPNFSSGRSSTPTFINEHWTVSTAASCIATFQSAASQVSAGYLVARDGKVYQFVRDRDTAWHNGMLGWNDKAIGVEHEHIPGQDWPAVQLASSRHLHAWLGAKHIIPLTRERCVGHRDTGYATQCPGDLPIDALLEGEEDVMNAAQDAKLTRLLEIAEHLLVEANMNEPLVWTSRAQRSLDVERGKPFDPALPPIDPRIRQ